MSSYKFRIGEMVDFVPAQRYSAASCSYKILRLLPSEGGERLYRIKTITEACDRVVRESELRAQLMTSAPSFGDFGNLAPKTFGYPQQRPLLRAALPRQLALGRATRKSCIA